MFSTKREAIRNLVHALRNPEGKATIALGSSPLGKNYWHYFTKRHYSKLFIPHKSIGCAIIPLSKFSEPHEYRVSVKGKNSADYFARRSLKMGYTTGYFNPNDYLDAIHQIHTSAEERQGRKMDADYLKKVTLWEYDDQNKWWGVFGENDQLVGYVWLIELGELTLMNRIMGHAGHLKNNIMYLMCVEMIEFLIAHRDPQSVRFLMYDTFGLEKNGLTLFKKRLGFLSYNVKFKQS